MKRKTKKSGSTYKKLLFVILLLPVLVGLSLYLYRQKIAKKSKIIPNPTGFKKKKAQSPSNLIGSRSAIYDTEAKIRDLFQKLKVEYSVSARFAEDAKIFEKIKKTDFSEYNKNPAKYENVIKIYEPQITNDERPPVYVKWISDDMGYGLFAKEDIPPQRLIAEYAGIISHKNNIRNKVWSWKYPSRGKFLDKYPTNMSLNGYNFGNEARFINHGIDSEKDLPNCDTEFIYINGTWRLLYVTKRYIKKDEEILVSYGITYWRKRELLRN